MRYNIGFYYVNLLIFVILVNVLIVSYDQFREYLRKRSKKTYEEAWNNFIDNKIETLNKEELKKLIKKHPRNKIIGSYVALESMKKKLEEVKERSSEYESSTG